MKSSGNALIVNNVTKRYADVVAVDDVSMHFPAGKMTTLVGPSGCGKSTLLRCIAGLERPDVGEIWLGDKLMSSVEKKVFTPPQQREMGMVFQSYAIWPHMTVFENVAFGLRVRKKDKREITKRVSNALEVVGLQHLEGRYGTQLSGGEQQRVALARSLAYEPGVLLLDEPLSNLDAKLRERMRFDLIELQRRIGITAVYVTHDQAEAMILSDQCGVMNKGKISQVGTILELYRNPADPFVADFLGLSNFFEGIVTKPAKASAFGEIKMDRGFDVVCSIPANLEVGNRVVLFARPEEFEVSRSMRERKNTFQCEVLKSSFLGSYADCRLSLGGKECRALTSAYTDLRSGDTVFVTIPPEKWRVFSSN